MIRIIAGSARGRYIAAPPGQGTRPTGSMAREALFSILALRLPGARVLDLFAGSGAFGIEALSRGAREACLVDNHRGCCRIIRENLQKTGLAENACVFCGTIPGILDQLKDRTFDLVFLDPPYRLGLAEITCLALHRMVEQGFPILLPGSLVVAETACGEELTACSGFWRPMPVRRYGRSCFQFFNVV